MAHIRRITIYSLFFIKLSFLIGTLCLGITYLIFIPLVSKSSTLLAPFIVAKEFVLNFHNKNALKERTLAIKEIKETNSPTMNMFINCPLSVKNNLNTTKLTQETNEKHMYPQPYEFLINEENKCKGKTPFLVFLICSQPNESSHRDSIRNTWGNETVVPGYHVVRLFMLGVQKEYSTENIMQESSKYHDIIQQDFQDTYNNLTHKVLMGIKWVTFYCPNAHFVMKTDTDVFVNTETLIQKLLVTISPSELYFSGFPMRNASPIRNSNSKWYMPMDIYPQDPYPDFCSGTGYVFSGSLASKIYNASLSIKYIHLEDVYIGLCLQRLGVPIKSPPRMSFFNLYKVKFSPCIYNGLITAHYILPSEMIIFWNLLQAGKHSCSE